MARLLRKRLSVSSLMTSPVSLHWLASRSVIRPQCNINSKLAKYPKHPRNTITISAPLFSPYSNKDYFFFFIILFEIMHLKKYGKQ